MSNSNYQSKWKAILMLLLCFWFISAATNAQVKFTITGSVKDAATNELLPGVNIQVEGTLLGTVTDMDGKFTIEVPSVPATLAFTYIGYLKYTAEVNESSILSVQLKANLKDIDEVVVIGYGTVKKDDITGSVAVVDVENIKDKPMASVAQALQGQAAGVVVTRNSGEPGSSTMVRIRGMGTITNNNPLYVVDGIPMSAADIDAISTNDIENVQVLKDASATAIYGSRGAGGVIVITTKKGKKNSNQINFEAYYGWENIVKSPDVMNAQELVQYYHDNDFKIAEKFPLDSTYGEGFNWWNAMVGQGQVQNYNISAIGGGETNTYNFSIDYFDEKGTILNTGYSRLTTRLNTTFQPMQGLSVNPNISVSRSEAPGSPRVGEWGGVVLGAYSAEPLTRAKEPDGSYNDLIANVANEMPYLELDVPNTSRINNKLIASLAVSVDVFEGLKFNSNMSTNFTLGQYKQFKDAYVMNGGISRDIITVNESNKLTNQLLWFNTLDYTKKIGNFDIGLMLGQEWQATSFNAMSVQGDTIPGSIPEYQYVYIARNTSYTSKGNPYEKPFRHELISYFGRANINYANTYYLTFTLRRDGSSIFGNENKFGYFPSFSGLVKLSELDFMKDIKPISDLKLRLGYGEVGNQDLTGFANIDPYYPWSSSWQPNWDYNNNSTIIQGKALTSEANQKIAWESQNTFNLGIDVGLFKNKLILITELYKKITEGVLFPAQTALVTGLGDPTVINAASIQNKGLEFTLQYKNYENVFGYDFSTNFSLNRNKVLDLGGNGELPINRYRTADLSLVREGYPIGVFYGFKSDGLLQSWEEAMEVGLPRTRPGDVKYIDIDGDRKLTFNDKMIIGNPHPDFTMGFNLNLRYKNFDFSSNAYACVGNDIHWNLYENSMNGDVLYNQRRVMMDAWSPENTSSTIPRVGNAANNAMLMSDRYLFDGSYFRIKRVQLTYTLPKKVSDKLSLSKFSVYMAVQNLATFTKYPGLDPEIGENPYHGGQLNFGVDPGIYPQPRTVMIGAKLKI